VGIRKANEAEVLADATHDREAIRNSDSTNGQFEQEDLSDDSKTGIASSNAVDASQTFFESSSRPYGMML